MFRRTHFCCLLTLAFAALSVCRNEVGASESPADQGDSAQHYEFFETKIRPLLVDRCFECHNEDAQESGLRLDSLQALLDGGERGPAIVVGKPQNSLLIHAVNHSEAELQMPQGDKLSAGEIADLHKWIEIGAPWPGQTYEDAQSADEHEGTLFSPEEKNFWAFVRPILPELPTVQNETWIESDVDRFILARLEANGLTPAPPATKRKLIRRAYFDLIGLPPTPEQVERFLSDDSPEAFENVVDSLLASPQYGERWGRHWLDVARYADSNGLDENIAFEFIYKYRDWVIQSINEDLPYNQFVEHQIAGDLIDRTETESAEDYIHRVKAVGFLSVGPKMVADDDPVKKKLDIVDEQLITLSQGFMALTIGCARCHDHKFDPIPTWDYYAMAGILKSSKTMEHLRVVAPIGLHELKPTGYDEAFAKYSEQKATLEAERDAFLRPIFGDKFDELVKDNAKTDEAIPADKKDVWSTIKTKLTELEKTRPQLEKIMAAAEGEPTDQPVLHRGNYLAEGPPTKRQFLRIIDGETPTPIETAGSGRLELARWLASDDHPLTARVFVNRVWRWHFGQGIVPTPDNFGRLGERPTHPELLDWLAVKFVHEDHWSLKRLHKRLMLSATYRMSTQFNQAAYDADPTNRLWWRMPRRRLEAEAIRDAILAVSGNLDLTIGGSLMPVKDQAYVTGAVPNQRYDNPRRTVYQPVYRSAVYDLLTTFDFPDPATLNGSRSTSVIAPQALWLMNSSLVEQASKRLASTLTKNCDDDIARVETLYRLAYGRPPTPNEKAAIRNHVRTSRSDNMEDDEQAVNAWLGVCRAVFASSEFLYLD
ncbi:MAG: PSD1 domain-containing protein [Planctomycetales bacterium]|nr:PSD1 domain-containing protein [Planctomycetales bacterium]